jgi:hypothetical protein
MAVPAITSIAPTSGSADGGTTITIVGTALGTPTAVAFGATPATAFAGGSATRAYAIAPAGTGAVHVTLTTAGGTSPTTVADYFNYCSGLFTVAEARAFDKGQLDDETYTAAAISAKEAEVREFLSRVCGVDFITTTHTDEYHDGDWSHTLMLDWPLVSAVSAVSYREDATWTAFTADELADLQVSDSGLLYREDAVWPNGVRNLKVTYTAGHATVPSEIKRAALLVTVTELPTSNVPWSAESYEAGGMDVSFAAGDGYADNAWHRIAEVRRAIRLYSMRVPGVA